jgi:hypothetical protein
MAAVTTNASRESSEFEFVSGNNGGSGGQKLNKPASPSASGMSSPVAEAPEGLFGWVRGTSLLSKVAERTKSSMETVITTLDPQMKGSVLFPIRHLKSLQLCQKYFAFRIHQLWWKHDSHRGLR